MLTLDLAIVTHRPEGIARVATQKLPKMKGVRYIVSWQAHENFPLPPSLVGRNDVEVHRLDAKGVSNNRNNALDHCRADVVLLADDDIDYEADSLLEVVKVFEENPDVDVATFKSIHENWRTFPKIPTTLKRRLPKKYYASSIEIALRRSTAGDLRCHPEIGPGAPYIQSGDDEVLLLSAIMRSLVCKFFPVTICVHPGESTGNRGKQSKGVIRGFGCVTALYRPWTSFLRIPLKAWRISRAGQASFFPALLFLTQGALSVPGIFSRGRRYLW